MLSLLKRQHVEVACQGELVLLRMGNVSFSLEFPLALQVSAAMRHEAKMAKLYARVRERGFYCVGILHDANADKPKRKRFMQKLPELLRARDLDVRQEGQLVVLKIGHAEAKFPFPTARMVAQWLRVRGKEAKRNANEPRHWSEIANMPAVVNGSRAW